MKIYNSVIWSADILLKIHADLGFMPPFLCKFEQENNCRLTGTFLSQVELSSFRFPFKVLKDC